MRKANKIVSIASAALLAACAAAYGPVEIEQGDMCSFCKMAVSDKRFAAEIVERDETVRKFDDIGCMINYRKVAENSKRAAAVYVADSVSKAWLPADNAFFVRSQTVKTPMSSGIVAFASAEAAGSGALRLAQLEEK